MASRTARAEEVRHVEFRASDDSDGQTLEGYAAVFNEWTNIRDSLGTYRERIAPGAFKRSLGQRTPVLQFDHGSHPLIGSLPLGTFSVLREDRNGLFVRARLSDNWLIQPVRDAIRDKAISGMSFRFRVIDDAWESDDAGEMRTIKEVELLEAGPVVFPAYEQTSVSIRSACAALDAEARKVLARELVEPRFSDLMASDVAHMLRQALVDRFSPDDDQWVWVRDHTDTVVIFDLEGFDESGTFRLSYALTDGTVSLDAGEPEPVTPKTTYVDGRDAAHTNSTSDVASEPADGDSPDEPPVASHETPRSRILAALAEFRHETTQETSDVHE